MFDHNDTVGPVWTPDPVVRSHPLNHGRVSWWLTLPGLDGGRQWLDLMGLNHGTLTGMTTSASGWRPTTRPGGWGHLLFNATNDLVTVADAPAIRNLSAFTVAAWIRPAGFNTINYFAAKLASTGWGFGLDGSFNGTHKLLSFDGTTARLANTALAVGEWRRALVTYNGTTASFYLDGKADGSGAQAFGSDTGTALLLGGRNSANLFFNGSVDDEAIWSRVLSAAEAAEDYNLSRRGYPGVLRRWPGMGAGLMAPAGGGTAPIASYFNRRRKVG